MKHDECNSLPGGRGEHGIGIILRRGLLDPVFTTNPHRPLRYDGARKLLDGVLQPVADPEPFIFAMHRIPEGDPQTPLVLQLGAQIEWALIGLVATVLMVGLVISRFIPRPRGIPVAPPNELRVDKPAQNGV